MALSTKDREWIEGKFKEVMEEVNKHRVDIAVLKVKAGVWGVLGGAATVAVTLGIYWLCTK